MGPEFEKGDGRLRPSLQQRLPGAEGPPEGCSTAPRHAACGGPIPSSRGHFLYSFAGRLVAATADPAVVSATWQWPRVMCSWSRAAQVPDRISDPQILDSFRFPGFPQQRSLSGGKQRRNSASSEEAPAAQLPRPGGVGCCVEKTAALSDLKTCTTSGICDSVLDSSVALPDALALSRGSPVQAVWTPRIASPGLARVRDIVHVVSLYNI